jgi:hypothetical protein
MSHDSVGDSEIDQFNIEINYHGGYINQHSLFSIPMQIFYNLNMR